MPPFNEGIRYTVRSKNQGAQEFLEAILKPASKEGARNTKTSSCSLLCPNNITIMKWKWLLGDHKEMPPRRRKLGRNRDENLGENHDIIAMPDKLGIILEVLQHGIPSRFHCVSLGSVDSNLQRTHCCYLPRNVPLAPQRKISYEWNFSDVIHLSQALGFPNRIYQMEKRRDGIGRY